MVTGGVAVVGTSAGLAYYFATRGTLEHSARRPERMDTPAAAQDLITRWVSRDGNEVRFATRDGLPPPARWTGPPRIMPIPAGAHEVPVISPRRTRLVPEGFNRMTGERVKYLDAIRRVLRNAGYNWDARVLMILWAIESGWDNSCWGFNVGNIKAQGTVYARSFAELQSTRKVFVTVRESNAVQVFGDRVASIDGYHAFDTAEAYARYTNRLLTTYPGAIAALEQGGEAGAAAFARALYGGPRKYSPANVDTQVSKYTGSFNSTARLIGAARFVR